MNCKNKTIEMTSKYSGVNRGEVDNTDNIIFRMTDSNSSIGIAPNLDCTGMIMDNVDDKPCLSNGQYWLRISNSKAYLRLYEKPNFIKIFFMKKLLGLEFYEAKEK